MLFHDFFTGERGLTKNILAIFTDVLLRFALAEDETGEAWVIPDTNAVYPGRGMRVFTKLCSTGNLRASWKFYTQFQAESCTITTRD